MSLMKCQKCDLQMVPHIFPLHSKACGEYTLYSQLGQDLAVIDFYKEKKDGFFVEIGAVDGIEISNTYLLETRYNWKGICVEAIPNKFEKLVKNRPNSKCVSKAVFSESGLKVPFSICHSLELVSGMNDYLGGNWKSTVENNRTVIEVDTMTLTEILDQNEAPLFIDYLSLDTEGTELEILKSVDLNKYTFGLIDVEHNYLEEPRKNIRDFLTANGYTFKTDNMWDDQYIHNSLLP
jgi:FkbM family methyltransferase